MERILLEKRTAAEGAGVVQPGQAAEGAGVVQPGRTTHLEHEFFTLLPVHPDDGSLPPRLAKRELLLCTISELEVEG